MPDPVQPPIRTLLFAVGGLLVLLAILWPVVAR